MRHPHYNLHLVEKLFIFLWKGVLYLVFVLKLHKPTCTGSPQPDITNRMLNTFLHWKTCKTITWIGNILKNSELPRFLFEHKKLMASSALKGKRNWIFEYIRLFSLYSYQRMKNMQKFMTVCYHYIFITHIL